jgi:NodT family efflux transporter outer membrane factor (OMF) lipoprotein
VIHAKSAAACIAAALLGGCSLAPKYRPPPPPQVSSYKEAGDWMPATPADARPRGPWWEAFGDPTLNELQRQLGESNPDLQAAVGRFEQARGVAISSRSNIFPTVNGNVAATRGKNSSNSALSQLFNGNARTRNDFIAGLDLSWEVDLFGRLRNAAAAAGAQAQSSAADLAAVQLALQAELATDYFTLRGDDTTIQLLEDTIKVYDRAYNLTHNRYLEGISAATDVDQADTLRQNARSQLAAVKLERAQLEHAVAVLLGQTPSGFTLQPASLAGAPPPFDAGLPSKLLERRPDVSRAERAMAAANAQIGVAKAAWFPVFSLSAVGGVESIMSSSWFNAPSHFWSVGPSATVPLLDAGARYGLNKQARAQYDQAAAAYRKTTLTAYQEVEDNLAGLHHLADQRLADEAAAASAESSAHHADQRYDAGVADYIEVTTTHTAALNAERETISVRVAQMNASVGLVRATGGGWTQDQLDHPVMP